MSQTQEKAGKLKVKAKMLKPKNLSRNDEPIKVDLSQPKIEDQKRVQHHLYGYVATTKRHNAMNWMLEAKQVINKLHKQNKNAILVGGSGLYLEFLYKGVNNIPVISEKIKNKVKKIFSNNSLNELYSFALKIDHEYTSKVSKPDSCGRRRYYSPRGTSESQMP